MECFIMDNKNFKEISKFILQELDKVYLYNKYSYEDYDNKYLQIKVNTESTGKSIYSYSYKINNKEIFSISSSINDKYYFMEKLLNSLFQNRSVYHENIKLILHNYYNIMNKFGFSNKIKIKNLEKIITDQNSFFNGINLRSIKIADIVYNPLPINQSSRSGGLSSKTSPLNINLYIYYNGKFVEPVGLMVLPIASNKKIKCIVPLTTELKDSELTLIMQDFTFHLRKYCHSIIAKSFGLNRKEQKALTIENDDYIINQLILSEMIDL